MIMYPLSDGEEEEDYNTTDVDTETESELSEHDTIVFFNTKPFCNKKKIYKILQEEEFIPE